MSILAAVDPCVEGAGSGEEVGDVPLPDDGRILMAAHPRDDDVLKATDDQLVTPEPAPPAPPADPEVPEGDGIEQSVEVGPGGRVGRPSSAFDAPEGDALEQATETPGEIDSPDGR